MASIFTRLQVQYRSNRFGKVGKRFGCSGYDLRDQVQLEVGRMRDADDERRDSLRRTLEAAIKQGS